MTQAPGLLTRISWTPFLGDDHRIEPISVALTCQASCRHELARRRDDTAFA
jgi:hypothetical protein